MKRFHTLVLVAAIAVLWGAPAAIGASDSSAAATSAVTAPAEQPRAVLPDSTYEFDGVVDGSLITHGFKIKNEGNAALDIHQVKTG